MTIHRTISTTSFGAFGFTLLLACSDSGNQDSGTSLVSLTDDETSITSVGDGDGDETGTGNGDGDGDGDGDQGDGDGDGDQGDGDGDGDQGDGDGDGDGDGGDGDGDGDGDPEPMPCDIPEANLAPAIPQVMLVLDKSGSMLITWDHDENPNTPTITRWRSLHTVVTNIIANFDDQMDFGAILFPSAQATNTYGPQACVVANQPEVPVGMDGQVILDTIPAANTNSIAGGTPGEDALDVAGMHLLTLDPTRPRVIFYISDGAANCGDAAMNNNQLFEVYDSKLPMTMADLWTDEGIPTYVVGIDMSTMLTPIGVDGGPDNVIPWCKMDELGEVGGKPKNEAPGMACTEGATDEQDFYSATNEIELQDALQQIAEDAVSCVVNLDPVPAFPELIEVEVMGMQIPMVNDCDTENGWVYVNPNGPYDAIELCGTACEELKMAGIADVYYFCSAG
jgi:hypothetical protein